MILFGAVQKLLNEFYEGGGGDSQEIAFRNTWTAPFWVFESNRAKKLRGHLSDEQGSVPC